MLLKYSKCFHVICIVPSRMSKIVLKHKRSWVLDLTPLMTRWSIRSHSSVHVVIAKSKKWSNTLNYRWDKTTSQLNNARNDDCRTHAGSHLQPLVSSTGWERRTSRTCWTCTLSCTKLLHGRITRTFDARLWSKRSWRVGVHTVPSPRRQVCQHQELVRSKAAKVLQPVHMPHPLCSCESRTLVHRNLRGGLRWSLSKVGEERRTGGSEGSCVTPVVFIHYSVIHGWILSMILLKGLAI